MRWKEFVKEGPPDAIDVNDTEASSFGLFDAVSRNVSKLEGFAQHVWRNAGQRRFLRQVTPLVHSFEKTHLDVKMVRLVQGLDWYVLDWYVLDWYEEPNLEC